MSSRAPQVAILAAGQGKRMFSDLPKVLHLLAGVPLLTHVLVAARALSPSRIAVVYGHGSERVRQALDAPDLHWVMQEPQLGTGHALAQAMPVFDDADPVLVLYGDVPLVRPATLAPLVAAAAEGHVGVLTVEASEPSGYGRIVRDGDGRVRCIVEHRDANPGQLAIREINTGILSAPGADLRRWLGRLSNANAQGEYYLTDVIAFAVAEGREIRTSRPADEFEVLGVNSTTQLVALERIVQRARAEALIAAGVWIADPARFDLRGTLVCGRDVRIDVGCVFEGDSSLGDGTSVGAHCVLADVRVGAGSTIAPFSHLEEAAVGDGCRIGPFARIRPGTELAAQAHIGNFVEVKASRIGERSKANHLAYVGDATVGQDVNIGAGTITCNYDGAFKHRTVIEDDVHIGSDCQLVAPVTVGRGATLGAGTTVWRDVPAGTLVVNDKQQRARAGWQRPRKPK